jgi:hypothetical protein
MQKKAIRGLAKLGVILCISTIGVVGSPSISLANSRCFEAFSHDHGRLWWHTTDAFSWHSFQGNQNGIPTWEFDHENSDPVWCMGYY